MISRFGQLRLISTFSIVAVIFAAMNLSILQAQTFQAQVTGTVRDSSGAVITGAKVTAKNLGTGVILTATSNETGNYTLTNLRPADYRITCEVKGFKRFEQSPVTLEVNQVLEVEITLQPGSVTEQVNVTASAAPLATETGSLSQVVTTRSIANLPLNIRDPFGLIALTPGAVMGSNFGIGGGSGDVGRSWWNGDFYVGGGRSGSQEVLVDGAPVTSGDGNKALINPPLDSVQEFSVQAENFSAQFGRSSGALVNMVLKSGTNDYHGLGYDYERHSLTDANTFFNNKNGIALPSWSRHQFGGNLAGPVKKGKWFVFGDYEGMRQATPQTAINTVPTAAQRQGNFSQTFASNGSLITIYDPSTTVSLPAGGYQRTAFTNNTIPTADLNSVAMNVIGYYPTPNRPGNAVTGANNFVYPGYQGITTNKYDIRSDVNFSDKTRMFATFSRDQELRANPPNMPLPLGGGRTTRDHFTNVVIDFTRMFSTTTVADVNISGSRGLAHQIGSTLGFNLSGLGLPASLTSVSSPQFPYITDSEITATDYDLTNGQDNVNQNQPRNVFAVLASVNHQRGKHSLKFGEDGRWIHFNEGQNQNDSGAFAFGRDFTQGPNPVQASSTAGFGIASFLLGDADSGSINQLEPWSTVGAYYALYAQDDWRLTSRLTLNLGLRWEVSVGDSEKYNRIATWSPTLPSPLATNPGLSNLLGTVTWIGKGNYNDTVATEYKGIGPRFGFAYSPNNKTVIRGGFGIVTLPRMVYGSGFGALSALQTTSMVASINGDLTPYNTLSNPFPTGVLPAGNARNPLINVGASMALPEHPTAVPYTQSWSLGVQRELPGHIAIDVHYWGDKVTHLSAANVSVSGTSSIAINQLPDQYLSLGSTLTQQVTNPFAGLGLGGVLAPATISRQQSLLPFPQYTGITQVGGVWGDSMYEAGSIQFEKKLSQTLTFMGVYTRSKSIDDERTPLDAYNLHAERALNAFDVPNNFRLSWVYTLPYGHGMAHGANLNRYSNAILGGWSFNSFVSLMSGFPVAISRPSLNNGQSAKLNNRTIAEWFNTSDFSVAPAYTFGNVGPAEPDVRSDWTRNIDTELSKNFGFAIRSREVTAQLRFEAFNLFNTAQFGAPNGSVTSTSFGTISSQANDPRDLQVALKITF
jgi:hypothetical protein